MKKLLAILLAFVLFASVSAVAENGKANMTFEGTTYFLAYEGAEIVDGQLQVKVSGFGNSLPLRNNQFIVIAWAAVVIGGEEVEAESVSAGGNGVYTFKYAKAELPEAVVIYPYEDDTNAIPLWAADGAAEVGIPAELVGTWKGIGTPKNGGTGIELTATIHEDGTGAYTFDQGDYHEEFPFAVSAEGNRFFVEVSETSPLSGVEGIWALDGDVLVLDITSTFASGGSYSYTAECRKEEAAEAPAEEPVEEVAEEPAEEPVEEPAEGPAEEPAEEPVEEPAEEPVEEPLEEPAEEPVEEAVEESTEGPAEEPIEEAVEEPAEEPAEEAIEEPAKASVDMTEAVLDALGDDLYRTTYDALLAGETIAKGSKGDTAKGVQQTLVAFGKKISVDGNVGKKTIRAWNEVQEAFGLEQTEEMNAEAYARLLPLLLLSTDDEAAYDLLADEMGYEYEYMRGCALFLQGKYYSAMLAFENSGHNDYEERMAACPQKWPKNGVLYKNPAVKGSSAQLRVKFNTEPDTAMLVKIYTIDGVLARTMFIGGTGRATASLPAGTYIVKDGTGKTWYGEEEAFGAEGNYEVMTFGDDATTEVKLRKNYRSTITVNVEKYDPKADSVGSVYENWGDF
ncbi:MAG: T9SS type A sorting domain-containing protein [Christensenellales bacterium]|jgi:hypothetical protein